MNIPTTSTLRSKKPTARSYRLHFDLLETNSIQRRLRHQKVLVPAINLDTYRFRTVIDWIEFRIHLGRVTQVQHVQQVLRKHLDRDSFIAPENLGEGKTFTTCSIRIQEPSSLALIATIHQDLANTFGEAAGSRVTAVEVSVDAYPRQPSDEARATLLGALQRTIWTDRDIWSNPNSRPRMAFGRGKKMTVKLSPEPGLDSTDLSRMVPDNHVVPFVDATMYLGARDGDDVMIRIMDKVKDKQHPDGTFDALPDDQKCVRIEARLKGIALLSLAITDVPSLRRMKITSIKKRYFQFRLPTFAQAKPTSAADVMHNTKEVWRARAVLRSGITALMAMDAGSAEYRQTLLPGLTKTLRARKSSGAQMSAGKRLAAAFVSWDGLNRKVDAAFQQLHKRQETAWRGK
jgi:hypothetical protein